MGKMIYQYDVKTPSEEVDADDMVKSIKDNVPKEYQMQEPVEIKLMFYGIKAAVCQFVCSDGEGMQDTLEDFLTNLEMAGDWELTFITRL